MTEDWSLLAATDADRAERIANPVTDESAKASALSGVAMALSGVAEALAAAAAPS